MLSAFTTLGYLRGYLDTSGRDKEIEVIVRWDIQKQQSVY